MDEMDERELRALLNQAKKLRNDEEREEWLDKLDPEVREYILKHARKYLEKVFAAAADHIWVANNVFDPMSKGEEPDKPVPHLRGGLPHKHHHHEHKH